MSAQGTALVVDDSPMIRHMVRMSLADIVELSVVDAGTGLEAIERLMVHGADLVVLDLNMPDMHGLEVLRFVRGHSGFASLPIIVLTTRGDEASRASAIEAGATLFRTKPFAPADLAADVRALIGLPTAAPERPGARA